MRLLKQILFGSMLLIPVFTELVSIPTLAESPTDLQVLQSQGFVISETTRIVGQFSGCDTGQVYHLQNGRDFECEPVEVVKNPELKILKNPKTGETRFLIDGTEYDGEIEKP